MPIDRIPPACFFLRIKSGVRVPGESEKGKMQNTPPRQVGVREPDSPKSPETVEVERELDFDSLGRF